MIDEDILTYEKIQNSGDVRVFDNGTLKIQNISPKNTGNYFCKISNGIGNGLSQVAKIRVYGESKSFISYELHFMLHQMGTLASGHCADCVLAKNLSGRCTPNYQHCISDCSSDNGAALPPPPDIGDPWQSFPNVQSLSMSQCSQCQNVLECHNVAILEGSCYCNVPYL